MSYVQEPHFNNDAGYRHATSLKRGFGIIVYL